jgi:hypothetical protein
MELAGGDESADEPAAALVFPTATTAPTAVRTATFTVDRIGIVPVPEPTGIALLPLLGAMLMRPGRRAMRLHCWA